ncbi:MAG: CRISPR-associated helicase Cas3', partial [Myxococcales bacterium]|nr:CRISPR-associated helicase Cas3' [Myxococcales bacterium]
PHGVWPGFWGKLRLDASGRIESWLPLVSHCLDVAWVFRSLVDLPIYRRRLQAAAGAPISTTQLDRLAVIALLHDLGKANLGFQDKVYDATRARAGHIRELAPLLLEDALCTRLTEALDYPCMAGWFEPPDSLVCLLLAAWSHHGDPIRFDAADQTGSYYEAKTRWWVADGARDPFQAIRDLMRVARAAFPEAFSERAPALTCPPRLQHAFAGLVMLADWLGSHTAFFPLSRSDHDEAVKFTSEAARKALVEVGLDVSTIRAELLERPSGFEQRFGFPPRPVQAAIDNMPTDASDCRLLLAESETGSGKTEAALAHFFRLFAAGQVDGLYFALPTRVAARELYGRVLAYVERVFPNPDNRPAVLLAVPGYVRMDGVPAGRILPGHEVRCDEAQQRSQERAWAAEHPKRFLAAPIAVGTIDQALLSTLQVRHAHLRSVCLDRSLLVVDEVHASDPYMRRLLKDLLDHHLGLGGHVLLLSATLGSRARAELTGTLEPSLDHACATPYPSLTTMDGQPRAVASSASTLEQKRVEVELLPWLEQPERIIPRLADALRSGARVLVVLNTVGRAIALQRAAEQNGIAPDWMFHCCGVITPHHGRYAPVDREVLDRAVSARLGKDSPAGPVLLIGTQTLEQSLDIDADLLITDLCPMDVLLQRIGRLHRHRRKRPEGFSVARCLVLVPQATSMDSLLSPRGEVSGAWMRHGFGSVYDDLRTLQLTRDLLAQQPVISLPKDNRWLVEMTTHSERLATLDSERWQKHAQQVEGSGLAQVIRAHYAAIGELYDQPFGEFVFKPPADAQARTRLGLDTLRILLDRTVTSPFGQALAEIILPGHMAPSQRTDSPAEVVETGQDGILLRYSGALYRYSRLGLEKPDEPAR